LNTYSALLFVHVSAAILWVGGAAAMNVFAHRARKAGPQRLAEFAGDVEAMGKLVMGPAALLVVASGLWMVAEGYWTISEDWILIGLALFACAAVAGAGFVGPQAARIARRAREDVDAAELEAHGRRLAVAARVELAVMFLIVFDMAVKPTLDRPATIGSALAVFAAVVAAVVATGRPRRAPALREPAASAA
jgi:uncharacterized membrane protein